MQKKSHKVVDIFLPLVYLLIKAQQIASSHCIHTHILKLTHAANVTPVCRKREREPTFSLQPGNVHGAAVTARRVCPSPGAVPPTSSPIMLWAAALGSTSHSSFAASVAPEASRRIGSHQEPEEQQDRWCAQSRVAHNNYISR